MPRTAPSAADRELIALTAADGHPVSAAQLKHWRRRGLLPSPARQFLGRDGTRTVYPPGTRELVRSLARHAGPGRSLDDLALLAYFCDEAPVPELALKTALARVYFLRRNRHWEAVDTERAKVPEELRSDDVHYDVAEAEALIELRGGGAIIRQMRRNLRRRPGLAKASRQEIDERVAGVLTNLNRPRLPEDDLEFMADLEAVLDFDSEESSLARLAVWETVAIAHAAQMAELRETSGEERLHRLAAATMAELADLRAEVRQASEETWGRATGGRLGALPLDQPGFARLTAAELVEWMSAKTVHPEGAVLAERYFTDSLADLLARCYLARVRRTGVGEGREAFVARTSGATGRHRRGG
ncbi:hypothetical protein [Kitasatospora sp. NPDC096204]|uniref:hypothetical protein n=1 Tax=Kitasatospora sp. NPDC096204 TaxID=3364094 RepID=UPI003813E518